ncbi:NAD(P)-binding protein [Nemania abortiva]|nr:NAD(P)-binding protein [Nemania abortiva]
MAAWYPMDSCNLYNASKAALRWLVVGMANEVKPFGIKHCLVEPGFFRTDLLKPGANFTQTTTTTRISDYAEINKNADDAFAGFHGTQLGNPVKGAEILYDVITSTGLAAGRDLPGFLPLGSDAGAVITKAAKSTIADIEAWADISSQSDYPEGK